MTPDSRDGSDSQSARPPYARYAGLGMELIGGIGGFMLLGWWLDSSLGSGRRWLIVGAVVGSVAGMYYLIRRAFEIQSELTRDARRRRRERE